MSRQGRDLDGGWAWFVVAGGMLLFIVLGGSERAFGILYVELLDRYRASAAETAWVGGIATSIRFFMGPVASALVERFSYRSVVIVGGVVRATGFIISGFAPSVKWLWLTYGVLVGVGGGLVYTNTLVIVAKYFFKKRAVATGMCLAGAGIGTLSYSYLYPFLLQQFGYQGAMLIIGALTLNICVAGAVYRSPEPPAKPKDLKDGKDSEEDLQPRSDKSNQIVFSHTLDTSEYLDPNSNKDKINSDLDTVEIGNGETIHSIESYEDMTFKKYQKDTPSDKEAIKHSEPDVAVKLLPIQAEKTDLQQVPPSTNNDSGSSCLSKVRSVFDYTLLSNLSFVLFAVAITLGTITTIVTVIFIPAIGKEHGMDAIATSSLLSAIGITDIFARVLLGLMYDSRCVRARRQLVYTFIYLLCGCVALSFAFVREFGMLAVVAVLFGLCSSSVITQRTVVLADLIGTERLSTGAGMCAFCQGLGTMFGPLIAGLLRDTMKTYIVCYCFTGGCAIVGSGLLFVELWIRKHKRRSTPPT